MSKEWQDSFEQFYADMGPRPEGMTLERKDPNGDYCKENCKWATPVEQQNNKRNNVYITYNGVTKTATQWGRELNINPHTLRQRISRSGWTPEKALTGGRIDNH